MKAEMERLWQLTQDPALHQRWDLRFSTIRYLPKSDDAALQQFLYETRIGFGLAIGGEGESTGTRSSTSGERTSALRFWSDDPKSLIRIGAGYWKYIPEEDGRIRFFTWYDYQTRFGAVGPIRRHPPLPPDDGVGNRLELRPAAAMDRVRYSTGVRSSLLHHLCRLPHRCRVGLDMAWTRSETSRSTMQPS